MYTFVTVVLFSCIHENLAYLFRIEMVVYCMSHVMSTFPADGLALGAAAGLSKADVELVIFLAIMLHKVWRYCL